MSIHIHTDSKSSTPQPSTLKPQTSNLPPTAHSPSCSLSLPLPLPPSLSLAPSPSLLHSCSDRGSGAGGALRYCQPKCWLTAID